MMRELKSNPNAIGHCGLYCGACKRYLNGSCPGCRKNDKASWCKVRTCVREKGIRDCAACSSFENPNDCNLQNNFIARIFAFVFQSNRRANLKYIKQHGHRALADELTSRKRMTFPR